MERVQGLVRKIVKVKVKDRLFKVEQFQCEHCGAKTEFKDSDIKLCPQCHERVAKKTFRDVTYDQVGVILSRKVVWECSECGKQYDNPQLCCNLKHIAEIRGDLMKHLSDRQAINIEGNKPFLGYMCDGCKTQYVKPVKCCSGSMMFQGTIYPNPNKKVLAKLNSLKVNAITGVIQ